MLIPGGGWERPDSGYQEMKASAPTVQQQGYATVAIRYDAGTKALRQVMAVYQAARRRYPDVPVCATGISAGGNLALLLAAREPQLECVAAVSAPTDLTTLARQDPQGQEAYNAAVHALGQDQLGRFSPIRYADRIRAKVLLVNAESDPVVPSEQGRELARALPGSQLLVLPPGPAPAEFAHFGGVQPNATSLALAREFEFLKRVLQGS